MPSTVLHALTMNIVAKNASPTILRISVSPDPKGTDALCDQKARHDENRSIMPTELSVARSMRRDAILAGVSMQFGRGHGYRGGVHVRAPIGRAACRARVCLYVEISVIAEY